jgi:DnaJ homolog subfamily A member 2
MKKEISLYEALTGFKFVLEHFDGKKILIQSSRGDIIKPKQLKTVEDLGLPFFKNSYKSGNLFIIFTINFPDKLSEPQIKKMKDVDLFYL